MKRPLEPSIVYLGYYNLGSVKERHFSIAWNDARVFVQVRSQKQENTIHEIFDLLNILHFPIFHSS
jgi:hypothetical protein